jgi:hypothetical protein
MKYLSAVIIAFALSSGAFAQEHTGHGNGGINVDRNANTRIPSTKPPRLVQTRVIAREPIKQWIPDKGEYVAEGGKNQAAKGHWEITGYRVTYRYVYDNGTSEDQTVTE